MAGIPERITKARDFPAVEVLLQCAPVSAFTETIPRPLLASVVREVIAEYKQRLVRNVDGISGDELLNDITGRLRDISRRRIGRVINASGIVVHTNLGRAPLSEDLFEHIKRTVTGYGNIEFDLASGKRGHRGEHCEHLLAELSGAEAGTVVNNCAAALFVMLNTLANRQYVIISRGELVQIGGGFRIPDILKRAGAKLREIGTTNITTIDDYANAIDDKTALILKVHRSNFVQAGFTDDVPLPKLVALGKKTGLPVINDLGSGVFVSTREILGYHEPTVQESVRAGAWLTSFSGDKMLGGGQAGLIVGQADLVMRIKKNPIFRALRVDKIVFSMLEKLLAYYLDDSYRERIKLWRLLATPAEKLRGKAEQIVVELGSPEGVTVEKTKALIGGGALPEKPLKSAGVVFGKSYPAERMFTAMRMLDVPVIGRVEDDCFVLDMKTIDDDDMPLLIAGVKQALAEVRGA